MSERAFCQLTKTDPAQTGQGPLLGDGETVTLDASLAGFGPPYTVSVTPRDQGAGGTVQRQIVALINGVEHELVALGAAPVNQATVDHITGQAYSRLRVRLTAGGTAPDDRTQVQINGVRNS